MRFGMWAAVLGLAVFLPSVSRAAERVVGFHSDIRIAADGVLTVSETIEVQVGGKEGRRGIARDLVPAQVLKVTRNGQPVAYAVERLEKGTRIRIHEAEDARPGKQVYVINYRAARQVRFGEGHDELKWNVAGGGWTVALDRLTAEVSLAQPVPAASIGAEASTGAPGAQGRNYTAFVRHGSAAFRSTRPLEPGEGMTIAVRFPKGVVAPPPLTERPGVLAGAGVLLGLMAFLGFRLSQRHPQAPKMQV